MDVTMGDADSADPAPDGHPTEASTAPHHNSAPSPHGTGLAKVQNGDPSFLAKCPSDARYLPHNDDFTPDPRYTGFGTPDNVEYWKEILAKCGETTRIRSSGPGKREVHAIGGMIIKFKPCAAETSESGTCLFDENEREAMVAASDVLGEDIQVPSIYFIGRVEQMDLLVQSRIPGVTLEAAWPFLSEEQKADFKQQTRQILERLVSISPPSEDITEPAYIFADCANARHQRRLQQLEYDLLFMDDNSEDFAFMHNDMVPSKIIVNIINDKDQIVGIIGWNKSGWFGWERAKNVHRQVRAPEFTSSDGVAGGFGIKDSWTDLYDIEIDRPGRRVKTEPLLPSLEKVPASTSVEAELPTPKKIADLKRGSNSRASSSERSSPSAPNKPAANKRANSTTAKKTDKKGTAARKPAPKKRKLNSLGPDSKDATPTAARRSGTPVSSRASRTPAPVSKNAAKENEVEEDEDEEGEDGDDGIFCICRRPDNHTWMIGCDGGCEDWFHGVCVHVNRSDADLIDKYICPNCEKDGKGHTTWKPMCRLSSCRQPARLQLKELSKYCCDEHGREFMRQKTNNLKVPKSTSSTPPVAGHGQQSRKSSTLVRDARRATVESGPCFEIVDDADEYLVKSPAEREELEDLGSRGGVLTGPDLKAAISGVASAKEFRELGSSNLPSGPEDANDSARAMPQSELYKDVLYNKYPELKAEEAKILERDEQTAARCELLRNREKFLVMVRQRVRTVLERLREADPKGGWKDICGYDSRLAWSDEELDEWAKSEEGQKALKDGHLDAPQVADAEGDSTMHDAGDTGANSVDAISRGICIKKRCERHKQWAKVEQQNITLEQNSAHEERRSYTKDFHTYCWKRRDHALKLLRDGDLDDETRKAFREELRLDEEPKGQANGKNKK